MLVDNRSIKFKPSVIMLLVVLALIIQSAFSIYQNSLLTEEANLVKFNKEQKLEKLQNVNIDIQKADLVFQQALFLQEDQYSQSWQKIWQEEIMPALVELDPNDEALVVFGSLRQHLQQLKSLQENALNTYSSYQADSFNTKNPAAATLSFYQDKLNNTFKKAEEDIKYWQLKIVSAEEDKIVAIRSKLQKNITVNIIFLTIGIATAIFFFTGGFSRMKKGLKELEKSLSTLSEGNLPKRRTTAVAELMPLIDKVNLIADNFRKIRHFALEVGEGKFENDIDVFNRQGEIGGSLVEMTDRLRTVAETEKQRIWMNEGFAKFGDLLRKNSDNLKEMADKAISQLVKYIDLNQGALFIKDSDNEGDYLYLASCYAYNRKKHHNARIKPGEDLVGQCFIEKDSIFLTDVPEDYINITSGLGEATARNIFMVPLIFNQQVYGVLEVASFNIIEPYEKEFIEKIAENLASAISIVKNNENTRQLLEESQDNAEQLRAQEEELRQNMEELAATQEEMRRNQNELAYNEAKTRMIYENAFDAIVTFRKDASIDMFNPAAEKIFGLSIDQTRGRDVHNILYMPGFKKNESVISQYIDGNYAIGSKPVHMRARRNNGEVFPIRVKFEQSTIGKEQVFMMFVEDTTKEELTLQQLEDNKKLIQEKEANLRGLINNTQDTIFAIDVNYCITVANDAIRKKYSNTNIDLSEGANILKQLSEQQAAEWKVKYDRALAGEQFSYLEEQPNGKEISYREVYLNPIKDHNNETIGVSVVSRDITEHLNKFNIDKVEVKKGGSKALADKMSKLDNIEEITYFIKKQIEQNESLLDKISQLENGNGHASNGKNK